MCIDSKRSTTLAADGIVHPFISHSMTVILVWQIAHPSSLVNREVTILTQHS